MPEVVLTEYGLSEDQCTRSKSLTRARRSVRIPALLSVVFINGRRKGNTLQTQVCIPCMDKLVKTWEKECSPGHRKCLVCGKEFVPNQITYDMVSGKYHVTGQLTCSIRCTDELYAGVLDKKKRRAHTRGD